MSKPTVNYRLKVDRRGKVAAISVHLLGKKGARRDIGGFPDSKRAYAAVKRELEQVA